jgi:hypothetical protein
VQNVSKSKRQKQIATVGEEIPVVAEPTLREFVLETIRQEGPVTFA